MGSRDHSCETCGRGGMNDDRPCICGAPLTDDEPASPRPATLTVGAALMLPEVRRGEVFIEYRDWCPPDVDDSGRVVEPSGFTGVEYQARWRRDVDGYSYTEIRRRMRNGRWWTWQECPVSMSNIDAPCTLIPSSETP